MAFSDLPSGTENLFLTNLKVFEHTKHNYSILLICIEGGKRGVDIEYVDIYTCLFLSSV